MFAIKKIEGLEILDSRGIPTMEISLFLENGIFGKAIAPSGASAGELEAVEKRDGGGSGFKGKMITNTLANGLKELSDALIGRNFSSQEEFDNLLLEIDGTENKSKLGANIMISASLAFAKASSKLLKIELFEYVYRACKKIDIKLFSDPAEAINHITPMFNVINGGAHANNNLDFQEFMIVPQKLRTIRSKIFSAANLFFEIKNILIERQENSSVGDEGGFAPNLSSQKEAIELIMFGSRNCGYQTGDFQIALDVAAGSFVVKDPLKDQEENLDSFLYKVNGKFVTSHELEKIYDELISSYPISSIEDPFYEKDLSSWTRFSEKQSKNNTIVVGDDLFVTNAKQLRNKKNCGNGIIIKPNQVGTLYETISTVAEAKRLGMKIVVSHRSGDSEDYCIADIGVGVGCDFVKFGGLSRSERTSKYNRLLRIGEILEIT